MTRSEIVSFIDFALSLSKFSGRNFLGHINKKNYLKPIKSVVESCYFLIVIIFWYSYPSWLEYRYKPVSDDDITTLKSKIHFIYYGGGLGISKIDLYILFLFICKYSGDLFVLSWNINTSPYIKQIECIK